MIEHRRDAEPVPVSPNVEAEQEFLDIAVKMIEKGANFVPENLTISVETKICETVVAKNNYSTLGNFDLITMSNFLTSNEGENQNNAVTIITKLKENMENSGSIIIIEPGEEESCKALKRIRNEVVNNRILNIFSPCIGIWERKTAYDCACFSMVRCFWQIPTIYEFLISKGLSKAKRVNVPFNYIVLRRDNVQKYPIISNSQHFTQLKNLVENVGQRVNVIALIRTVITKSERVNFSLCDGSCSFSEDRKAIWVDVFYEQLKQNGINTPLIAAEKITLKKVLVKLDGEKINLEIDKNSRIVIDY